MRSAGLLTLFLVAVLAGSDRAHADPQPVERTVTSVASIIEREYFDVATANRVATVLRERLVQGRYGTAVSDEALAALLTDDLQALTRDKHLAVRVVTSEKGSSAPSPTREERGRRDHYGVTQVTVLPGNVGWLTVNGFYRLDEARQAIDAAFAFLRETDALVIDLRNNGGGAPDTVSYVASYLLPDTNPPVEHSRSSASSPAAPLFEIVPRTGETLRYALQPVTGGPWAIGRPAYVLTSHRTFSAGEGLAFLLQAYHRVEVIGEQTAGAANPGREYPVDDRFEVMVPNGQVRIPRAGRNWEGDGVTPDVPCQSSEAPRLAYVRALERLARDAATREWRETLERFARDAPAQVP